MLQMTLALAQLLPRTQLSSASLASLHSLASSSQGLQGESQLQLVRMCHCSEIMHRSVAGPPCLMCIALLPLD